MIFTDFAYRTRGNFMALKLNRPNVGESQQPATNAETARFISGATRTPTVGKPKLMNFRLSKPLTRSWRLRRREQDRARQPF
jgi:hypothetical protein